MKIVSAAVTVDVQHLAAGKHARRDAAFQRVGAELRRADAARRDLRVVHAHDAGHRDRAAPDEAADRPQLRIRQLRQHGFDRRFH